MSSLSKAVAIAKCLIIPKNRNRSPDHSEKRGSLKLPMVFRRKILPDKYNKQGQSHLNKEEDNNPPFACCGPFVVDLCPAENNTDLHSDNSYKATDLSEVHVVERKLGEDGRDESAYLDEKMMAVHEVVRARYRRRGDKNMSDLQKEIAWTALARMHSDASAQDIARLYETKFRSKEEEYVKLVAKCWDTPPNASKRVACHAELQEQNDYRMKWGIKSNMNY